MQLLSDNAIIHISAGFEGPFILQAFSIRRDLYRRGLFHFCVTDGTVYIGANYECQHDLELDNYHLVQVTAKFEDRFHPISIKSLDIVSTNLKRLLGHPPCTLQDYFNRETRANGAENLPRKRVKGNEELSPVAVREVDVKKTANTPPIREFAAIREEGSAERRGEVINLEPNDRRLLRVASDSEEEQEGRPMREMAMNLDDSRSAGKNSPGAQVSLQTWGREKILLKDLFDRQTGWTIFCRVNYISIVRCQNGLVAANFILADQEQNQLKCVYFAAEQQQVKQVLQLGRCYLFSKGEIKKSMKDKESQLQITFDKNSEIIPQRKESFHSTPAKYIRIDKILDLEHMTTVNVLGAVRKVKTKEHLKNKTKFIATLCDPIKHIQIDFMLFLSDTDKEIHVGMVIILHNFQIFKQNIYRLNSIYRSYYYEESGTGVPGDAIFDFHQRMAEFDWEGQTYKNISIFPFTQRSIHGLREICRRTDDERLYSSLDVWALDIARKKSYQACRNCKKPAERKEMNLYECASCKRMVETILIHALCVTFADFTGSTSIDVIGQHAENLLSMKAGDFNALSPQEQNSHLESLKYKNITLRLKSEKKADKRESHSVWGIEKPNPEITLKEIKKQMNINRSMKQEESDW